MITNGLKGLCRAIRPTSSDAVLVNRPSEASGYEGLVRVRPSTYAGIYKVHVEISPTTFNAVDFADPSRELQFSQPSHADRLIRLDLPELELVPDQPRKLEIQDDDWVTWTVKKISRFSADGRVFLHDMDGGSGEWYDLAKERYRYGL